MLSLDVVQTALLLTIFAGLSTGIGSAIAFFIRHPKTVYLSLALGFSAGVMIYVSFGELLPNAIDHIGNVMGSIAFFVGILAIGIVDILIPNEINPHHFTAITKESAGSNPELMRTGVFTALAIAIHNFPEGLATFGTALGDIRLGMLIALAIAIHNIPEGISVSMPIFFATNNRKKAFVYSFLSGVAEPVGAIIGFVLLMPFLTPALLSSMLAFVAGIMVYISVDELLPMAHNYGHGHVVMTGFVLGMGIMAISLILL
ncbi:MAG: zinc transporter ZupT [Candidatus Thermoplasmatota archaeon]|nr:zinc transporter ZupT [Candidatus Thermoplasmatota archaeon]